MKILLDTHAFIWWDSEPSRLSPLALSSCTNVANELLLSVASLWEIQIKQQLGKISLNTPLADMVRHQQATNGVTVLPIQQDHVLALNQLPVVHKDPFDRLLIAQALHEGAVVLSADSVFGSYPVRVIW